MANNLKNDRLGLIAGNGSYPLILGRNSLKNGVKYIATAAFKDETDKKIKEFSDVISWFRVGQLSKMINFFKKNNISQAIMAGQITPKKLYTLRPDLRTLKILTRTQKKNAESLFSAVADELSKEGIELLPATTFMHDYMPKEGLITGKKINSDIISNINWGFDICKKISNMDIGQSIVVRDGTVLAVEGFDGTNETIKRGGKLGRGKGILIKVAKKNQDLRFDVPVIGSKTILTCTDNGIKIIIIEAEKTIILDKDRVLNLCKSKGVTLYAWKNDNL